MNRRILSLVAASSFGLSLLPVSALESRTWTSADGKTVEAELLSFDGTTVYLKGNAGQRYALNKNKLSLGDQEYIKEYAPGGAKTLPTTQPSAPAKPGKPATPAKDAQIDPKSFKKASGFELPQASFEVLETPHFKIMHSPRAKPADIAELAERLWADANFFHPTFAEGFKERKLAIFLVDEEETYNNIGKWYASLLSDAGKPQAANSINATWAQSAAGQLELPTYFADSNGVLSEARVFRTFRPTSSQDDDPETVKGVWVPFRVHCISKDLLDIVTGGGVTESGSRGYHALVTGYAYYKEISLTGKSETSLLSAVSAEGPTATGGFKSESGWPEEFKKGIRKKEITPSLSTLWGMTAQNAMPATNVMAFSFIHFLHASPDRLAGWTKLAAHIGTSHQVPEQDETAKMLGFESAEAMEKAWLEYLSGPAFK